LLAGEQSQIISCLHTHTSRTVQTSTSQIFINPGSLVYPAYTDADPLVHSMATYNPLASNAMLEKRAPAGRSIDSK